MSKRRKGVSAEEKRIRILNIYHESKEVFNLKEIEKLGGKAGVVVQTIKDVNQALADDSLIDFDKIGSGNYFWSFPSKNCKQLQNKQASLEDAVMKQKQKINETEAKLQAMKDARVVSEERTAKLERFSELTTQVDELKRELKVLSDNDPEVIEQLSKKIKVAKDGADRWTDNVFNLKLWVVQKRSLPSSEVDKWLGLSEDFDYIE